MNTSLVSNRSNRLFTRDYLLICTANFCFWAGTYCIFGAFPLYVISLGGAASDAGLVTGAIPLTSFFTQLLLARSLARLPRVLVLVAAPLVLPIGGIVALLAEAPWMLVVASCIFGTGYSTFQTAATTLASDVTPPPRRGEALGIYGSFTTVSLAIGPALGIGLLQAVGAWATFLTAATLGVTAMALGAWVHAPHQPPRTAQDNQRRLDPIIYFCMFVNAGLTFTHGALIALLPLYASSIGMGNPGLFYTVFAFAAIGTRATAGRVSDSVGRLQVAIPATLLLTTALWAIAAGPSIPVLLGIALVYAVGYASLHPANLAFAVDRATAADRPMALAIVNSGFALGMGTGAMVMGAVLAASSFGLTFAITGLIPLVTTGAFMWRYLAHRPPRLS